MAMAATLIAGTFWRLSEISSNQLWMNDCLEQYTLPIAWVRYRGATEPKKYLEQVFAKHQAHFNCTLVDPRYASLHNDARSQSLMGKYSFPVFSP